MDKKKREKNSIFAVKYFVKTKIYIWILTVNFQAFVVVVYISLISGGGVYLEKNFFFVVFTIGATSRFAPIIK